MEIATQNTLEEIPKLEITSISERICLDIYSEFFILLILFSEMVFEYDGCNACARVDL